MAVAISSLAKTLRYKNEAIVQRFAEENSLSLSEAEVVFLETKKWLWLCAKQSELKHSKFPLTLFYQMQIVDVMWHTFILFTKDYADFCDQHFGCFIHHVPKANGEKELSRRIQRATIRYTYEFIYDQLGEDTILLWCEGLRVRFPLHAGE